MEKKKATVVVIIIGNLTALSFSCFPSLLVARAVPSTTSFCDGMSQWREQGIESKQFYHFAFGRGP